MALYQILIRIKQNMRAKISKKFEIKIDHMIIILMLNLRDLGLSRAENMCRSPPIIRLIILYLFFSYAPAMHTDKDDLNENT